MKIEPNGVHTKTFFTLHHKSEEDMQDTSDNGEITVSDYLIENYKGDRSLEGFINELNLVDFETQEALENQAEENYKGWLDEELLNITNDIFMWMTYFEPRVYNEEIAIKCNIIPFKLYNPILDDQTNLLAYGACGMDMSPRLEAYQYLTAGTVDEYGILIQVLRHNHSRYEDYFTTTVGKSVLDEIKQLYVNSLERQQ